MRCGGREGAGQPGPPPHTAAPTLKASTEAAGQRVLDGGADTRPFLPWILLRSYSRSTIIRAPTHPVGATEHLAPASRAPRAGIEVWLSAASHLKSGTSSHPMGLGVPLPLVLGALRGPGKGERPPTLCSQEPDIWAPVQALPPTLWAGHSPS